MVEFAQEDQFHSIAQGYTLHFEHIPVGEIFVRIFEKREMKREKKKK
jgi:hypothetical protein